MWSQEHIELLQGILAELRIQRTQAHHDLCNETYRWAKDRIRLAKDRGRLEANRVRFAHLARPLPGLR
jgi:hypothetical protein